MSREKKDKFPTKEDEHLSQDVRTEEGIEVTSEKEVTEPVKSNKNKVIKRDNKVKVGLPNLTDDAGSKTGVAGVHGGPTPGVASFNVGSYSGKKERSLVGDSSDVQRVEGNYNPEGRFRKKVDAPVRSVNDQVSEQIKVEYDSLASLHNDKDSAEGFRGRIHSDTGLLQKTQGTQVAEKSMFRSVDEVKRDELMFSQGQNIYLEGYDYLGYPEESLTLDGNTEKLAETRPSGFKRGNYMPTNLKIKLKKNSVGEIIVDTFKFDVEDLEVELPADEYEISNVSAVHSRIHGNYSELVRQTIEDKAGNESLDSWSPLARAVNDPTALLGLMKDVEIDTGNIIGLAHRKTAEALSYQINRTGKDGLHIMRPIVEASLQLIQGENYSGQFENGNIFSKENLKKGSPGLIIKMFDSTPKYDSKGVFLNLKRKSFANALNIAETNASNFRMGEMFKDTLNKRQSFSTIGREYDPAAPVYITDNVNLIHPYDFRDFINIEGATKNMRGKDRDLGVGYSYQAPNNKYFTMMNNPLLVGLYDWVVNYRSSLMKALGDEKATEVELDVPIVYSTTAITLWSLMILHATPFIRRERIASMRELLDYQNFHGYPFEDTTLELKTFWNTSPDNYTFSSIDEPLSVRRMKDTLALTWMMPELYIPFDEIGDGKFRFIAPFYMNERNVEFAGNLSWNYTNEEASFSFPIVRSGVRTDMLDTFVNMPPSTLRLTYDIATKPPIATGAANTAHIYKYDVTTDGILAFDANRDIKMREMLSLPRQVGLWMVAPYGILGRKEERDSGINYLDRDFKGETSYRIKTFFASEASEPLASITDPHEAVNNLSNAITKSGANLSQDWIVNHAGDIESGTLLNGIHLSQNTGIELDISGVVNTNWEPKFVNGVTKVAPFVKGSNAKIDGSDKDEYILVNLSNHDHFRLNYVPFILSPWDSVPYDSVSGEEGVKVDPFNFAYKFNFVGFLASDYTEETDIRINKIQDQSTFFISDKWVEDTKDQV